MEKYHYYTANPMVYGLLKEYAKHNRKYPTQAEATLWEYLCNGKAGHNFRRQHIIGEFIADFVCLKSKLIIELDGGYHQLPQQKKSDEERTQWLNGQGFTVLRFSNEEVICNTEYVINKIKKYMCNNINQPPLVPPKGGIKGDQNEAINPPIGGTKGGKNEAINPPIGGTKGGPKVGILGAAGYTGGELIRLLVNHPQAEIVFANSESNAGNPVTDVHEGLFGDTDLIFTDEMPFDKIDVVFFCFGHGKSAAFLKEHSIPEGVKIIDLAQDFRLAAPGNDYVYGLPEINRDIIKEAQHVANPGCFATCIQLGLLPAAKMGLLKEDIAVNAITGSTGAGQKPAATTHFSWRTGNMSIYKAFTHQHVPEIRQSLTQVQGMLDAAIDFIPYRGDFARGIFATEVVKTDAPIEDIVAAYKDFYRDAAFTHYSDKPIDLKQVVNTNKALIHCDKFDDKLLVTSCIDNLLKGAVGQAVQNMNIMFGLDETTGLSLKASAF